MRFCSLTNIYSCYDYGTEIPPTALRPEGIGNSTSWLGVQILSLFKSPQTSASGFLLSKRQLSQYLTIFIDPGYLRSQLQFIRFQTELKAQKSDLTRHAWKHKYFALKS